MNTMHYTAEQVAGLHDETFARLRIEVDGHILNVRLARPEKKNAMDGVMLRELAFALAYAHHMNAVRAVRLSAEGDVFCAGADLKALTGQQEGSGSTVPLPEGEIRPGELLRHVYKPCIAQVEGHVYAGGILLLAGATLVVAEQGLRFGLPEVKRGLFPFHVMAALCEVMPPRRAVDWCVRGYELPAEQAREWGLVTHLTERGMAPSTVDDLLEEIVANAPHAIRTGLKAFAGLRQQPDHARYAYLQALLTDTIRHPEAREGIAAFREKRLPRWPE